ncbi:MAG: GNAT family N-acetyltransferase, partial [Mesorhizobium sp.]
MLAIVRRYEAAGFRAWPAAAVHYDGTWVVRLTAGHPAKRLNSVNPLDPGDIQHIADRIGRAALKVSGSDVSLRPGLSEIIGAIQPEAGLFALEDGTEPLATLICVHDGDLAGLFEIATDRSVRNQGHGRHLILSALKWARLRGAREAWLQVEADNAPA